MNSLEDLIHKHFILNNSDIFRPLFNKYCNLIYGKEYPYNADNIKKMLECVFNDIHFNIKTNIWILQNKEDLTCNSFISVNTIGYKEDLIKYLNKVLCQ